MADIERIRGLIRANPDFPKPGINFQDIFPVFQDPTAVESLITHLVSHVTSTIKEKIDVVIGLDARGFLFGPIIALRLAAAFAPVRKKGKLPGEIVTVEYVKEYGVDVFEMEKDAVKPGQNVIVVDDLIATGGSAAAAGKLVNLSGGKVLKYLFVIEAVELNGAAVLNAPLYSVLKYEDSGLKYKG
ncbi:12713_t:CDS:2 [Ambispora gerdemannii]|uniref:adenine phosphoribosyltransferase n=1 Tax=Ambispora gerdemannii TaxID=144530 RepID=A0A9N8WPR6_9GLOM|nr:12713_t:CDS:2 [Ambispora gerdemannii]